MSKSFCVALLVWPLLALGQQPGPHAIRVERMRADIGFLSSDALEGRRSLERGAEVAVQFVAAEFAKAGLKPAGGDSYIQPVPVIEYRLKPDGRKLAMRIEGRTRQLAASSRTGASWPCASRAAPASSRRARISPAPSTRT